MMTEPATPVVEPDIHTMARSCSCPTRAPVRTIGVGVSLTRAEGAVPRHFLAEWLELVLVLVAAAVGLGLSGPIGGLVDHGAIDIVLFVLVLSAAMTLPVTAITGLRSRVARAGLIEVATLVALPLIAWSAAHVVPPGPVRLGIVCIGVAPAEIATVALATVALGQTAVAALLLVLSTIASALLAAPLLGLLAGGGIVRSGELLTTLGVVVVVPFVIGIVLRTRLSDRVDGPAGTVATGAVTVLVALVASQVVLDADLARAGLAIVVIVGVSAVLGTALGRLLPAEDRSAVLLSTSMRDFAVAAGIGAAAFGPSAAAPLGLYGIIVMVWGSLVATLSRRAHGRTG
jgi:predicted Na+-dependent transporter